MSLTISKLVPARTKTLTARWCRREFMVMGQTYRAARARAGSPMDACFWCEHKFVDGEMMALAAFDAPGNKVLCGKCADELLSSAKPAKEAK